MRHLLPILFSSFVLLAACHGPIERPTSEPTRDIATAPSAGVAYAIDPASSWLHVRVYKTGRLARFGHNHVISSHAIDGTVMLTEDPANSSLTLQLPLASFVVDDPRWRAHNGDDFPGEINDRDREGTRANMLSEKLLNAANHPVLHISSTAIERHAGGLAVQAQVALAGTVKPLTFPVSVTVENGIVRASGELTVTHEQLGLAPFSALLGALKVADEIGLSYHLTAQQVEPST